MRTEDFARLVVDANVLVSATIGTSFPLLASIAATGIDLIAPVQQWSEARHVLLIKIGAPTTFVDEQLNRLQTIVRPVHPALLEPFRDRALRRLRRGGQRDWPVLAASYLADAGVWSHDKDLWGTGAAIWFTQTLADEIALAAEEQSNA